MASYNFNIWFNIAEQHISEDDLPLILSTDIAGSAFSAWTPPKSGQRQYGQQPAQVLGEARIRGTEWPVDLAASYTERGCISPFSVPGVEPQDTNRPAPLEAASTQLADPFPSAVAPSWPSEACGTAKPAESAAAAAAAAQLEWPCDWILGRAPLAGAAADPFLADWPPSLK